MTLPNVTIVGNLTADPELRFTQAGIAMCNFSVAASDRRKNEHTGEWEDGDTTFLRCTAWRVVAENVAESLSRGSAVIVVGRLKQNVVEKDGQKNTYFNLEVESVGVNLMRGPVRQDRHSDREKVTSTPNRQKEADPWGSFDQPPF